MAERVDLKGLVENAAHDQRTNALYEQQVGETALIRAEAIKAIDRDFKAAEQSIYNSTIGPSETVAYLAFRNRAEGLAGEFHNLPRTKGVKYDSTPYIGSNLWDNIIELMGDTYYHQSKFHEVVRELVRVLKDKGGYPLQYGAGTGDGVVVFNSNRDDRGYVLKAGLDLPKRAKTERPATKMEISIQMRNEKGGEPLFDMLNGYFFTATPTQRLVMGAIILEAIAETPKWLQEKNKR